MILKKKIFVILLLISFVLSGCQGTNYEESVDFGAEYPVEVFPVYKDAVVYKYNFDDGIIDITFGSKEDYEKVSSYYDLLFEHENYDVTAKKLTNQRYVSSGKTTHYKYLLEVNKAVYRKEKKSFNTVVNLRVFINGFAVNNEPTLNTDATPTPQKVDKTTPAPTNTLAPTDTPQPTATPYVFMDKEVISTADMSDDKIFLELMDVNEEKSDENKVVSMQLKIINYGEEETGYISIADFALIDDEGTAYHSDMQDGIFASGVNVLPGGYCIDYITFVVEDDTIPSVLSMPEGLGNRVSSSYDLELAPLAPSMDAGKYNEAIVEQADISHIPTFIIGQEFTIDDVLTTKLLDAQYFENHTTVSQENLMYTFSMEFTNISSTVIIPVELRDFVLYDIKHNIMIKPTVNLTPYDELAFNPVQNGLSENYHISFDVFEQISENYLCLLLSSQNQQNNPIIYKIR